MKVLSSIWFLASALFHRSRIEDDMDHELRGHIQERADDLERSGLSRAEAERRARLEFGGYQKFKEECHEALGIRFFETLIHDLRYAFRTLRKSPGFTLVVVLAMAVGIGANTAVFSALDTVLWKPLPVADPGALVSFSISRQDRNPWKYLPAPFIRQLRDSGVFPDITSSDADGLSFSYDGRAERILGEFDSPQYFNVLGVMPYLGELFSPAVQAGHWAPEAVLSYGYWKARFGGDPKIIGRTIRLNTYPFTIVGVSPPSFFGLDRGTDYELRIPLMPDGAKLPQIWGIRGQQDGGLRATARLRPGWNLARAEAAADAQLQWFLRNTSIDEFRHANLLHLHLVSAARGNFDWIEEFRTPLYVLFALAAFVLLISCANVANMLLARAAAREREIAVRVSIGAGRLRLIRQLLTESTVIALAGAALGILLATFADQALLRLIPQGHVPLVLELRPDGRVLLFTILISSVVGILFGLAPALHATRGDLAAAIKTGSAGSVGGSGTLRKLLVVAQVACSLILLVAAGTFMRSLSNMQKSEFRSDAQRILLFTIKPQQEIYPDQQKRLLVQEVIRRVSALPGVDSAAFAEYGALGSRTNEGPVMIPGHDPLRADIDYVTPGFFDMIGIRRISGRDFSMADLPGAAPVAIVNQSLAGLLFGRENPIGRTLRRLGDLPQQYQIVGVVADSHYYDLHGGINPGAWFALSQDDPYMPTLHVRIAGPITAAMTAEIQKQFDAIDRGFPVFNVKTFETRIQESLARERMLVSLSGAFGITAILLAAVGLYGLLAYSVSRRTREIGVRMALGANRADVFGMVLGQGALLAAIGIVLGLALALPVTRMMVSLLYGIQPPDALTLAVVSMLLLATALLPCYVPARRAMRVDPITALRHD